MEMIKGIIGLALLAASLAAPASAQDMSAFKNGPVFEDFGPHAPVPDADFTIPAEMDLFITFDVAKPAGKDEVNRTFESAARFVNMHNANGVEPARVRAAVVVHGKAAFDLLTDEAFAARQEFGEEEEAPDNRSAPLIREGADNGVRFILCGQTAIAYGISADDLVPGVELALSAMTAHAVLQRQGYTVNPF